MKDDPGQIASEDPLDQLCRRMDQAIDRLNSASAAVKKDAPEWRREAVVARRFALSVLREFGIYERNDNDGERR